MRIAVCCANTQVEPWLQGLRAALPSATVSLVDPEAADFETVAEADYAVVWLPPQAFIDSQRSLKAIFNMGAGVDALMQLKLPPGVPVVRLDDAGMSVQMAEYVCHAVIRHFRAMNAHESDVTAGRWTYRKSSRRADFTVGVMGLGVLGARVCQALAQFDYPVLGWSRSPKALSGVRCFSGEAGFKDFLSATRVLVCLLPLTPETENIMCRDTLSQLQPDGYVINVARGGHLVDADLLALIDSGQLAGATLDVFRTEPLPVTHPFCLQPKITLTPHMSARTLRDDSIAQIAGKLHALEAGAALSSLAGVVNLNQGY
jgi:glyoxylate/hydroxypyruvate reductase A